MYAPSAFIDLLKTAEEILNERVVKPLDFADMDPLHLIEALQTCQKRLALQNTELRRVLKELGAYGDKHIQPFANMNEAGELREWHLALNGITEKKLAEETLLCDNGQAISQLDEIKAIYRSAPVGLCVLDRNLKYVRINDHLAEINGIPAEEHIGKSVRDIVPALADFAEEIAEKIFQSGEPRLDVEFSATTKSQPDVLRYLVTNWLPLKDPSGEVVGINVVAEEITERKQSEEALRKSEKQYHELLEMMFEAYCVIEMIFDKNGKPVDFRYMETNPAFERHATQPMLGKRIKEIVPDYEQFWLDQYGQVALTGQPVEFEHIVAGLGDQWFHVVAFPIGDQDSRKVGVEFKNITDRKQAEEAFRKSEEKYRTLFDRMTEGFALHEIVTDNQGRAVDYRFLDVNPAFERLTGLKRGDLIGKRVLEVLPDTEAHWIESYGRVALTGEPAHFENRSAELGRWYEVFAYRTVPRRFAVVFTDISERKKMQEELDASHRLVQSIVDNSTSIIYAFDLEGRFLLANKAVAELLDSTPERMIGRRRHEFMPRDDADWHEANDRRAIEVGRALEFEEYSQLEGRSITWLTTKFPLRDAQGRIYAVGGISADISERKRAEETLEQRVAERTEMAESRAKQLQALVSELTIAEQRERQRLAEVLHDNLQQFLAAARLNSEILLAGISPEKKQTAETVINLIEQSLQTSRNLTAELAPPVLRRGSLSTVLAWLAHWMTETHGLEVELQADGSLDPEGEEITIHVFQSVRELLFNAVKHAGVKSARVEMALDREGWLRVTVTDHGTGFDPDKVMRKARAGSGFGLFSIRERLELMGGSFEIGSSPGNGAAFSLIVPIETKLQVDQGRIDNIIARVQKAKRSGDKIRVLLVDDHTVFRDGLATMLTLQSDIEIAGEAADGNEAVEKARELQPDVILMDISMPKMNGIEAARIIHSELPHIRIIGLSMHEKQDEADRMFAAGASAYCTKDGATDALLSAIRGGGGGRNRRLKKSRC